MSLLRKILDGAALGIALMAAIVGVAAVVIGLPVYLGLLVTEGVLHWATAGVAVLAIIGAVAGVIQALCEHYDLPMPGHLLPPSVPSPPEPPRFRPRNDRHG